LFAYLISFANSATYIVLVHYVNRGTIGLTKEFALISLTKGTRGAFVRFELFARYLVVIYIGYIAVTYPFFHLTNKVFLINITDESRSSLE